MDSFGVVMDATSSFSQTLTSPVPSFLMSTRSRPGNPPVDDMSPFWLKDYE